MKHIKLFESWNEDGDHEIINSAKAVNLIVGALNNQANGEGRSKPIMLLAPRGVGKTAIINKAAREAGVEPIILDLSSMNPEDFMGIPRLSTKEIPNVDPEGTGVMSGRMENTMPSWFPMEGSGILVLDSINRADRQVANAAILFAQTGRLGSAQLPEGWLIVATPDGMGSDMPISSVISDRFAIY